MITAAGTCPSCAFPNTAGARFCGRCGTTLAATCPRCAAPVAAGLSFCTSCGARVNVAMAPLIPAQVAPPPEERRIVSVLFVDLVGYSAAAAGADPEDVRRAQSAYFSTVRSVVERFGGTLEKYVGDAVMAVFGAPTAHGDDPYRAVAAGLAVRDAVPAVQLPGGRAMRVRVGVATGEALVDLGGDAGRGEALVTGDVVNLACRFEQAAAPGTVLVSAATRASTSRDVDYVARPPLRLDERPDLVEAWQALGVTARAGDPSPPALVGREGEVAMLAAALRRVVRDRVPRLVTVLGDAGLGKTRLVRELPALLAEAGLPGRLRVARCRSFTESAALSPLAEIVRTHAEIGDGDVGRTAEERLRAAAATVLPPPDADAVVARLAPLLGLAGAAPGEESLAALGRFLLAAAEAEPLTLVLEDVHCADVGLLDFLEELLDAAAGVPLLVVVTARPQLLDERPTWGAKLPHAIRLTLGPLDERETVALFAALLAPTVLPAQTQRRLVTLAGGNPLYAEEFVRMLADTGVLASGELGEDVALPQSVQGVIASRLDLLAAAERTVLQAAAVIGPTFWPGALVAVLGADRAVIDAALHGLVRRELVQRRSRSFFEGEPEYEFRHVLVRDVAFARIPRSRRAEQHRRVAEWLEHTANGDDAADLLAHHRLTAYELASEHRSDVDPGPARRALLAAAERALRLALPVARSYVDRALQLWPDDVDPAGRWRAVRLAQETCFLVSEDEFYERDGPRRLAEASAALLALGETAEAARAETLLGQVEWYRAEAAAAFRHLERAVALLERDPASEQKATALAELARLNMLAHHHDAAITAARAARDMAVALGHHEVEAHALVTLGTARYVTGDIAGMADQEAAVDLARRHRLRALHRAANNLAVALQEEGELRRSFALIDESEEVGRNAGLSLTTKFSHPDIAMRAFFAGDWTDALRVSGRWLDSLSDTPHPWEIHLRALCAWLRLLRGARAEAVEPDLQRSLELAQRGTFPQLQRPALGYAALCRLLTGDVPGAAELHEQLDASWRHEPATASREWVQAAVWAAGGLDDAAGGRRLAQVVDRLAALPRQTRWVRAALASGRSRLATGTADAGRLAAEAARTYDEIGDLSSAALAAAEAARGYAEAGRPDDAAPWEEMAREFCRRNDAVRVLATLPAR
jgi:predicted ATPase/class 3 adenylate cyclase